MKHTKLMTALGVGIILLAFMPTVMYGIYHVGVWGLALFGGVIAVYPYIFILLKNVPKVRKVLFTVFNILLVLGLAAVVGLLVYLQTYPTDEMPEDATVVVLGCGVKESGPSRMLTGRLKTAKEYLDKHPSAVCIVSGGQGEQEPMTEADAMAEWLVANGIDEKRILREAESTNTNENMMYSSAIIRAEGLSENVVVITDAFHCLRGTLCAKRYGLTASAYPAYADWFIQQAYWLREVLGIMKFYFIEQ